MGASVAGVGMISEGQEGRFLIPFVSFDRAAGTSGTYQALIWDSKRWRQVQVGGFHATNGVLQFLNLRGSWYGFSNTARTYGGALVPTYFVGNERGKFGPGRAIGVFSPWGEFDSAAKGLKEDRIGITGRDRMDGAPTDVFAEKIGQGPWVAEPILVAGKPTSTGFSTLIGYDRGDEPWIAYESQPGGSANEIGVLTRSGRDHEWSLVPVSSKAPSNLVGAYLPPSEDSDRERVALAWAEKTDSGYDIKTAVLDLARRKLRSERTVASGIQAKTPPLPSIAVSHDGRRATLGVMSAETHQGWTGGFASGEFENLREYAVAATGQGVTGFPQAFYLPCGDSAELLVGVGAPPTPWGTPDLGKDLRIEALSASR